MLLMQTIESTRIRDETLVTEEDDDLEAEEGADEFAGQLFLRSIGSSSYLTGFHSAFSTWTRPELTALVVAPVLREVSSSSEQEQASLKFAGKNYLTSCRLLQ